MYWYNWYETKKTFIEYFKLKKIQNLNFLNKTVT